MNEQSTSGRSAAGFGRKPRFSLATLLNALALCGVLLAWYVDHCRLKEQIPTPPKLQMMTYRLSNASPELAAEKLTELFRSESIGFDANSNSVIVAAERNVHDQIQMVLRHIDRKDTEFVDDTAQFTFTADTNASAEAK